MSLASAPNLLILWCPESDSNQRPTAYEAVALPLSYRGESSGRFLAGSSGGAKLVDVASFCGGKGEASSGVAWGSAAIGKSPSGAAHKGLRQERVSKAPQWGHRERQSRLSLLQVAQT